jgi:hypothetical protein
MNPMRGEAKLGERTLCYDMNAFCRAESALGRKLPEIMNDLNTGVSFEALRSLIWAGLQRHHPCTVEEAGEIISDVGLEDTSTALSTAMQAALPQSATGKNPRKKGGSPTG